MRGQANLPAGIQNGDPRGDEVDDFAAADREKGSSSTVLGKPHSRGWSAPMANQTPDPPIITSTSGRGGDAPLGGSAKFGGTSSESNLDAGATGDRQYMQGHSAVNPMQCDGMLRDGAQGNHPVTTYPVGGAHPILESLSRV